MIGNDKRNEILLALKIIKNECKKNKCEDTCPFEKNGVCLINAVMPGIWEINDNEKWKAFR